AQVSGLFFGKRQFAPLVFPLSVMVAGLTFHTVTYAFFRGKLLMKHANVLQVFNLGLLPLLIFSIQRSNVRAILLYLGLLTLIVTTCAIVCFTPWKELFAVKHAKVKQLLRYGLQRLPGDLALLGLFTLPITVIVHAKGVEQAGFVAFGVLFLTIVSAMFNPIGLILLPKASRMLAAGTLSELREHVRQLVKVTITLTGIIAIAVAIMAPTMVRIYLGPGFAPAAIVVRVI